MVDKAIKWDIEHYAKVSNKYFRLSQNQTCNTKKEREIKRKTHSSLFAIQYTSGPIHSSGKLEGCLVTNHKLSNFDIDLILE